MISLVLKALFFFVFLMTPDSILFWKRAALLLFEDADLLIVFDEAFDLSCSQLMAFALAVYSEKSILFSIRFIADFILSFRFYSFPIVDHY
jgi:hypothetical protein